MTDKAVSTEDLCLNTPRNPSVEAARLEAILNTLVENKVVAIKNERKSSSLHSSPRSLLNKLRGTPTSTVSSKEKEEDSRRESSKDLRRTGKSVTSPKTLKIRPKIHSFDADTDHCHFPHRNTCTCLDQEGEIIGSHCYCKREANGEIRLHMDDDYISLKIEDYDEANLEEIRRRSIKRAQRKKRRRRKRRIRKNIAINVMPIPINEEDYKVLEADELSQRARITIAVTACLLLFMCLLLVGITLRMAPIIDDMVESPKMSGERQTPLKSRSLQNLSDAAPKLHFPRQSCQLSETFTVPRRNSHNRRDSRFYQQRYNNNVLEQRVLESKRKRLVYAVIGVFLFIFVASVLVVIVTLTHQSTLLKQNNTIIYYTFSPHPSLFLADAVRKENEELMNSLTRDTSSLHNSTASVPSNPT